MYKKIFSVVMQQNQGANLVQSIENLQKTYCAYGKNDLRQPVVAKAIVLTLQQLQLHILFNTMEILQSVFISVDDPAVRRNIFNIIFREHTEKSAQTLRLLMDNHACASDLLPLFRENAYAFTQNERELYFGEDCYADVWTYALNDSRVDSHLALLQLCGYVADAQDLQDRYASVRTLEEKQFILKIMAAVGGHELVPFLNGLLKYCTPELKRTIREVLRAVHSR